MAAQSESEPEHSRLLDRNGTALSSDTADSHGFLKTVEREFYRTFKQTLLCSPTNVLLPCVLLGLIAGAQAWNSTATFILNFFAIVPLAEILSYSTEELAKSIGQIFGGLINATFGNVIELLVGISALKENKISIVQSAMVGSILSGMLLILGSCFFASGLGHIRVHFNVEVAGVMSSLMVVSSAALIVPSAVFATMPPHHDAGDMKALILSFSRTTSAVLLFFYLVYLYFSVKTHSHLFTSINDEPDSDEACHERPLNPWAAGAVLIMATVAVASSSDYLVDSVDGVVENLGISKAFVALIVVPIVGNAGELAMAVKWSLNGKLELAIGVIVASTLQIAIFVMPVMVILGWIMDCDMSLRLDAFQTTAVALSVLVVNCLIRDGRTNYFEGFLLIAMYFIIGIAFWVQPNGDS